MTKKKKSKGKTVSIIILAFIVVLLLSASIFSYFFGNVFRLRGTYIRKLDITNSVISGINDYIGEATFGKDINASDYIDNISMDITLTLGSGSSYKETISDEDYDNAQTKINEAIKSALIDLITIRMEAASLGAESDIEELLEKSIGMSFDEYLLDYGPQVLPPIEELREKYTSEGRYSADRNTITIDAASALKGTHTYLVSDKLLIIEADNGEYIYLREEKK